MSRAAVGLVLLLLAVAACEPVPDPEGRDGEPDRAAPAADRAAIDSLRRAHLEAMNGRDVEGVLSALADDVVHLSPAAPPFVGTDAMRAMLEPAYAGFIPRVTMEPVELTVHGDVAVEWGCLGGTLVPVDGGEPIANDGKYLTVYGRDDAGRWRIRRHAYNPGPCGAG